MTFPSRITLVLTALFWAWFTVRGAIDAFDDITLPIPHAFARLLMLAVMAGTSGILVRCAFARRPAPPLTVSTVTSSIPANRFTSS